MKSLISILARDSRTCFHRPRFRPRSGKPTTKQLRNELQSVLGAGIAKRYLDGKCHASRQ